MQCYSSSLGKLYDRAGAWFPGGYKVKDMYELRPTKAKIRSTEFPT